MLSETFLFNENAWGKVRERGKTSTIGRASMSRPRSNSMGLGGDMSILGMEAVKDLESRSSSHVLSPSIQINRISPLTGPVSQYNHGATGKAIFR